MPDTAPSRMRRGVPPRKAHGWGNTTSPLPTLGRHVPLGRDADSRAPIREDDSNHSLAQTLLSEARLILRSYPSRLDVTTKGVALEVLVDVERASALCLFPSRDERISSNPCGDLVEPVGHHNHRGSLNTCRVGLDHQEAPAISRHIVVARDVDVVRPGVEQLDRPVVRE